MPQELPEGWTTEMDHFITSSYRLLEQGRSYHIHTGGPKGQDTYVLIEKIEDLKIEFDARFPGMAGGVSAQWITYRLKIFDGAERSTT
ncbi:MAG: hypothetical protein M1827_005876 [Pycnora praestabilis]|nr:MAG: hypothetical protein M1827_005876 [Pycnora praestabilis]